MHRILKFARLKLFLLVFIVSVNTAQGQFFEQTPLHLFKGRDSNPITCGKVIGADEDKIKVRDGLGKIDVILIKDLSTEDQRYVKSIRTSSKVFQRKKIEAEKSFLRLNTNSPNIKKKALEKIGSLGYAAQHLSKDLSELTLKIEDTEIAASALFTFMKICPRNDISINRIFFILKNRRDLAKQIEQSPLEFLELLARFTSKVDLLLIQVSYSGELTFFNENHRTVDKPKLLTTTNGPKNQIRAMACQSLAQIRTAIANSAILEVAETAASPINGRIDRSTLLRILIGLKVAGRAPSTYPTFPSVLKSAFPREFQNWQDAYKQNQNNMRIEARLLESSKMQNFYDRNRKFLVRGNVKQIENGRVLINDIDQNQYAFQISQLSTANQEQISKTQ